MATLSLWRGLLGLDGLVVERVRLDPDDGSLVIDVRPLAREQRRCGTCRRRCRGYDQGRGRRRWRSLDHGLTRCYLEAGAPRVACRRHGVVVAHVPWAAHDAGHTHTFDQQVAWLATHTSKAAVTELMRVSWRTVGAIITRFKARAEQAAAGDGLDGLRRIGIDEISYRRNSKYLTVVVDHDSGLMVWMGDGRTRATLAVFFDALGPERAAQITHVSADGAAFIEREVTARCPGAVLGIDPFHVVKWTNDALARVRIDAWNQARALAKHDPKALSGWNRRKQVLPGRDLARGLKGARYALSKNPENLTERQQQKLAWIATADPRLYRGYQLKEGLRLIFRLPHEEAVEELDGWLKWARRCRIPAMVDLARKITPYRERILDSIKHGLSNGLVESANTKTRLLMRTAFGFHSAEPIIALAMLSLGRHRPTLPGRT